MTNLGQIPLGDLILSQVKLAKTLTYLNNCVAKKPMEMDLIITKKR